MLMFASSLLWLSAVCFMSVLRHRTAVSHKKTRELSGFRDFACCDNSYALIFHPPQGRAPPTTGFEAAVQDAIYH
ncbi:hypothetical protein [Candidatus Symbiopectobacterium sp.]|uniref:hypothetical protein n=1 Tax=Candidatus Symbiopectobacterium sp. TaxID=2816440 RepID=UPI0025BB2344|nr:hypothetical protein [Candidatus Symbiopectobacterium sp.]